MIIGKIVRQYTYYAPFQSPSFGPSFRFLLAEEGILSVYFLSSSNMDYFIVYGNILFLFLCLKNHELQCVPGSFLSLISIHDNCMNLHEKYNTLFTNIYIKLISTSFVNICFGYRAFMYCKWVSIIF